MKKQTLNALKNAIYHWKNIRDGDEYEGGRTNCPLCFIFHQDYCWECPVRDFTGESYCLDTPYGPWIIHQESEHSEENSRKVYCNKCRRLAEDEIEFLEQLLLEGM